MDPQSPPKRMTRARAAAQATQSSIKPTKIVTAAARAKATRPAAPTATKRKLRSEDLDQDEELDELDMEQPQLSAMKPTRSTAAKARPKKGVEADPMEVDAPAPSRGRGRPPKKIASEASKEAPTRITTARTTRTRKAQAEDEQLETTVEPVRKTVRGRLAAIPKPTTKKTVHFEEPEKENIVPTAAAKGKTAAKSADMAPGLRAKPVRRAAPAVKSSRTASRAAKDREEKAPTPLSPKKVTQIRVSRDVESEDELGSMDKTPIKPLMRSPIKPPVHLAGAIRKAEPAVDDESETATLDATELPTIILGSPARRPPPSPYKDAMKSPARRVEGLPPLGLSTTKSEAQSGRSPLKASLLQSPAKRPQLPLPGLQDNNRDDTIRSPFKMSLLQSPAKRPHSPTKMLPPREEVEGDKFGQSPAPKATLLATPGPFLQGVSNGSDDSADQELKDALEEMEQNAMLGSPTRLRFPGRLSAVLPRHADPALKEHGLVVPETTEEEMDDASMIDLPQDLHDLGDSMEVDQSEGADRLPTRLSTTPPQSPPKRAVGMFSLRQKDLDPYHDFESESEDELAPRYQQFNVSPAHAVPATPCPTSYSRTSKNAWSQAPTSSKRPLTGNFGFTPLADQLSGWRATSPQKALSSDQEQSPDVEEESLMQDAGETQHMVEEPTLKPTFFDDEMLVHSQVAVSEAVEAETGFNSDSDVENRVETPVFEEVPVTQEDVALAAEADEMSLMEPERLEDIINIQDPDDSVSDASQEYGDENEIPIDPALLPRHSPPSVPPVTPQRMMTRTFHTTSKVPLKPADESSPRPAIRKRSHSISRLPTSVRRPNRGLTRNATVISYSPSKKDRQQAMFEEAASEHQAEDQSRAGSEPPATPAKSETGWSTAVTPARTPRRDINPALLRGAVVFVDVHTTEGADASGIFVELLTQMGAKCVKSWSWNPSSPPGKDVSSSRIGITHVVYKDGGKRTMEKVRETGGVVQCVGVSWVLDCERENQWLDEAPYYIDTSLVPRGGARRRKSMEPKALANLNGMLVSGPIKGGSIATGRECQTAPSTPAPANRRDSCLWMRTPEDEESFVDGEHEDEDSEWNMAGMLTPVPKTPAPETIACFAANITPSTPVQDDDDADSVATNEHLVTRTCPPKTSAYHDLGEGVLARDKDENVLMRLMAARRKSLQYAPKVGSPLSKTWN